MHLRRRARNVSHVVAEVEAHEVAGLAHGEDGPETGVQTKTSAMVKPGCSSQQDRRARGLVAIALLALASAVLVSIAIAALGSRSRRASVISAQRSVGLSRSNPAVIAPRPRRVAQSQAQPRRPERSMRPEGPARPMRNRPLRRRAVADRTLACCFASIHAPTGAAAVSGRQQVSYRQTPEFGFER
jgi:hypothetical protein